jgi:molybdopterin-guanine dinucleotide biosynthesis protein A
MDKCMLLINGKSIIESICEQLYGHFDQILISASDLKKFAFLDLEIVPDKEPNQGPLMGIASALKASASELNFVTACDIPKIEIAYVRRMLKEAELRKADIVLPITSEGKHEPLFAVYRKSSLEVINKVLSSGGRKISDVFELCKVRTIEMSDEDWLVNLNTIDEYEEFKKKNSSKFQ